MTIHSESFSPTPLSDKAAAADQMCTGLLLVVQAMVFYGTFALSGLFAMALDGCSESCNNGRVDTAFLLNAIGGAVVFIAALIFSIRQISRRHIAFFLPVMGCVCHIVLFVFSAGMADSVMH